MGFGSFGSYFGKITRDIAVLALLEMFGRVAAGQPAAGWTRQVPQTSQRREKGTPSPMTRRMVK
jgi:hypothetical protein